MHAPRAHMLTTSPPSPSPLHRFQAGRQSRLPTRSPKPLSTFLRESSSSLFKPKRPCGGKVLLAHWEIRRRQERRNPLCQKQPRHLSTRANRIRSQTPFAAVSYFILFLYIDVVSESTCEQPQCVHGVMNDSQQF